MTLYDYLGVDQSEINNILEKKEYYYITYYIKKSSGKRRRIDAPQGRLKEIQRLVLKKILYSMKPHNIAHGFTFNRGPRTNAIQHVNKKYIITIDIKDFFASIPDYNIFSTLEYILNKNFKHLTLTQHDNKTLYHLITYHDRLPQGAPTSPVMANLCCIPMDCELMEIAKELNLCVTRYADDITLSAEKAVPGTIRAALHLLSSLLHKRKLRLNPRKTRISFSGTRQKVTGVVVNKQTGVPKEVWKNLRAQLHNLHKTNTTITSTEYAKLRGKIEWVHHLNNLRGTQLLQSLSYITVV